MARVSRSQLENDLKKYKESLEASKDLPNSVIENNIKYNPSTGQLEYSMPDDLNENQFNENLETNQPKEKVFVKYEVYYYTRQGRKYVGKDKVHGFIRSTKDEKRMDVNTKDINEKRVFGNNKKELKGQRVTHTFYVDVSDIVLKEPNRGALKPWAYDGYRMADSDKASRADKIVREIKRMLRRNYQHHGK